MSTPATIIWKRQSPVSRSIGTGISSTTRSRRPRGMGWSSGPRGAAGSPRSSSTSDRNDSADRLDGELMAGDELLGLRAGEDPLGRAHRADATRPHGAGQLEAFDLGPAFQEPDDIAGIEGIAAPRAIDIRDGIGGQLHLQTLRDG